MNFYLWFIAIVLFTAASFVAGVPEFLLVSLSAVLPLLLSLLPGIGEVWPLQVAAALLSGAVLFGFLRTRFKKLFRGEEIKEDRSIESGKEAEVLEPVSPGRPGRIRLHGTSWTAVSLDDSFLPGDKAVILEKEGLVYTIGKWNKEEVWKLPSSD